MASTRAPLFGALLTLLGGCVNHSIYDLGEALPEQREVARLEGSSLASVMDRLGPPLRLSVLGNGLVMAWEHWRVRELRLGFSLGVVGAELINVDWGDARVAGEFLLLTFDEARRVKAASLAVWDEDFGDGRAVQPVAGIAPIVDVDDLLLPLPAHRWGDSLLLPIPSALNNAARPGMGDTGIERRGTPGGIGQRSQELE